MKALKRIISEYTEVKQYIIQLRNSESNIPKKDGNGFDLKTYSMIDNMQIGRFQGFKW